MQVFTKHPPHAMCPSLAAQMVKNLPAMQETWVQSLGWEDSLEKGIATRVLFWSRIQLVQISALLLSLAVGYGLHCLALEWQCPHLYIRENRSASSMKCYEDQRKESRQSSWHSPRHVVSLGLSSVIINKSGKVGIHIPLLTFSKSLASTPWVASPHPFGPSPHYPCVCSPLSTQRWWWSCSLLFVRCLAWYCLSSCDWRTLPSSFPPFQNICLCLFFWRQLHSLVPKIYVSTVVKKISDL